MKTAIKSHKDTLITACYLTGVIGLMSGEVLLATALIATASLLSMFHLR
jgi:hypothetical protein